MQRSVKEMVEEVQTCRESDDYTEIDIRKWEDDVVKIQEEWNRPLLMELIQVNTKSARGKQVQGELLVSFDFHWSADEKKIRMYFDGQDK